MDLIGIQSAFAAETASTDGVNTAIVVLIAAFFLPTLIAYFRDHRAKLGIAVLNIVLGFTVLGWIVALVWACNSNTFRNHARIEPAPRKAGGAVGGLSRHRERQRAMIAAGRSPAREGDAGEIAERA